VKVRYFSWVRERVGKAEEDIDPPDGVATVGDLVAWLTHRGEGYAYASKIRTWSVARSISASCARCADYRRERNRIFPADDRRLRRGLPNPK
jgi:molybdopterin converting factor small subunit